MNYLSNKIYVTVIYGNVTCNKRYHSFILSEYFLDKSLEDILHEVKRLCSIDNKSYFANVNRSITIGDKVTLKGRTFNFSYLSKTYFDEVLAEHITDK